MVALSRNVAAKHAMEMLLTGEMIAAGEAWRIGLVNRVVPAGEELRGRDRARPHHRRRNRRLTVADRQGGLLPPARDDALPRPIAYAARGDGRQHAGRATPRKASAPSSTSASRAGRTGEPRRLCRRLYPRDPPLGEDDRHGRRLGQRGAAELFRAEISRRPRLPRLSDQSGPRRQEILGLHVYRLARRRAGADRHGRHLPQLGGRRRGRRRGAGARRRSPRSSGCSSTVRNDEAAAARRGRRRQGGDEPLPQDRVRPPLRAKSPGWASIPAPSRPSAPRS
ncbi:MAG: enoyl-CoA hydratase-related protein [Piscinibacter sp.]